MKKKKLVVDSDYLIFQVCEGSHITENTFANEKVDLKPFKERFKQLVKDLEDEVALAYFGEFKIKGKTKLLFSDPETNFRYELYPNYKNNRKGSTRSDTFYAIRKWAHKKYGFIANAEADDAYAYYVGKKGYIGVSFDKDCLYTVAGVHFDPYHSRRCAVRTGELEARNYLLKQCLMGDNVDGIVGVPRVGEKTAIKLLDEFGWTVDGAIKAYESKGLTKDDMILNMRLVNLTQWHPKKGITLWKP